MARRVISILGIARKAASRRSTVYLDVSGKEEKGPREEIFYFSGRGDLTA